MSELDKNLNAEIKKKIDQLGGINTEELEQKLKNIKEETSEFISKYPLTSAGIALGLGFMIGRMFSRK
jgi:ElaB/YqjD/DUF883 family membrane-anchored ribosome-binding protein